MLPHYSPLKVAESFSMLSGLYPGRIDLGLGRAAGTDQTTAIALQRDRRHLPPDDFPQQLAELLAYLGGSMPRTTRSPIWRRPCRAGRTVPTRGCWARRRRAGSGRRSVGLPYAFADFIQPGGAAIAARYRAEFQPSSWLEEPRVVVAASAICAETDAEAERLAASSRMAISLLLRGRLVAVPPVEKAVPLSRRAGGSGLPPAYRPPRDRRLAVDRPRGHRSGGARVWGRGGDDRDHHPRSCRPPALL